MVFNIGSPALTIHWAGAFYLSLHGGQLQGKDSCSFWFLFSSLGSGGCWFVSGGWFAAGEFCESGCVGTEPCVSVSGGGDGVTSAGPRGGAGKKSAAVCRWGGLTIWFPRGWRGTRCGSSRGCSGVGGGGGVGGVGQGGGDGSARKPRLLFTRCGRGWGWGWSAVSGLVIKVTSLPVRYCHNQLMTKIIIESIIITIISALSPSLSMVTGPVSTLTFIVSSSSTRAYSMSGLSPAVLTLYASCNFQISSFFIESGLSTSR